MYYTIPIEVAMITSG